MSLWEWLMNPSGLTAHGFCLSWAPGLVGVHVVSDGLIGLSYFSIPLAILSIIKQRPEAEYGWVAHLFIAFILACGTTHLWSIVTLWMPAYGIAGVIKLITAAVSIATAAILWPLIPKIVLIPSVGQLSLLNAELAQKVEDHKQTANLLRESEAQVQRTNLNLERRVAERTLQLEEANASLTRALFEKTQAQISLSLTEAQFRADFEESAIGKFHSHPVTGIILRVNKTFAYMLGHKPDELVGKYPWELTFPNDRSQDLIEYQDVLDKIKPVYVREKRFIRNDGSVVWARVTAKIIRPLNALSPTMTVAVVENIDERVRAQEELRSARVNLELLLEERNRNLAQKELLLREVHHRVKNNLQIVDSLLSMQSRVMFDSQAKSALQDISRRVRSLSLVHQQLMASSDLETLDISPFLKELTTNIIESGGKAGIRALIRVVSLRVALDIAIPLGLIVTELITNCLKHAFVGENGNVEVDLRRMDDGDILLRVVDDGHGKLANVATNAVSLGSSIVSGLVMQLNGTITVSSERGTCTEIRFKNFAA